MHELGGGCHCGNIRVEVILTRPPSDYQPRACDCDFCTKHGAAYVSDSAGSLCIRIRDSAHTRLYRQGDGLADCVLCSGCGVLIGVVYRDQERWIGAVNVRALAQSASFGSQQTVSPRKLPGDAKVQRWRSIWFPTVQLERDC